MKVSIVIPIYNAEKYLEQCLQSVCNQSFKNYEVLLVNDGSTDSSLEICEKYRKKNDFVKIINQKNYGVSEARNSGIKQAKGQYIAFVDADDTIERDYLQSLMLYMSPGGMVACSIEKILSDTGEIKILSKKEAQISAFHDKGMKGFPFCKLFDRKVLIDQQIFFQTDISICEDLLFLMQYLYVCRGRIVWVNMSGYNYRYNPYSALNGRFFSEKFNRKYLTEYEALKRIENYLICDPCVLKAWKLRKAKSAVTCLRTIQASSDETISEYRDMVWDVRNNVIPYLTSNQGAVSSKISILLSSISPALELFVWRLFENLKRRRAQKCDE